MFRIYQREQNRKSVKIILVICALVVGSSVATASLSYSVIEGYKTWIDAESSCRSKNGIMATPSNLNQLKQALIPFRSGGFWIGGYRRGGYWMWISDLLRTGCFKEKYTFFSAEERFQCSYQCYRYLQLTSFHIAYMGNLCICFNDVSSNLPPNTRTCTMTGTSYVYHYFKKRGTWYYKLEDCIVVPLYSKSEKNSAQECSQICDAYSLFSLQGNTCVCLIDYYLPTESVDDGDCNVPCAGNPVEMCGGSKTVTVYKRKGHVQYVSQTISSMLVETYPAGNCLALYKYPDESLLAFQENCQVELPFICQQDGENSYTTLSPMPDETTPTSSEWAPTNPPATFQPTSTEPFTTRTSQNNSRTPLSLKPTMISLPTTPASNTGSPHPTETLNTLPSSGSDNEKAVGSKTGMYAGIGVGIVILGVVGVVALIVWKRKYLTRRKKPVNFQMNEVNSEHMNTERSQHNQNPNDTAMNNTYGLTNHSKSADGILDITSHPSADTYGKIWMSSSAGNNTNDEYSYAQHNEPADYDYAFARPQETDTTPARSESTEYDKLGVIKTSDNYESTGNTYCHAGQGTDAYTTSAKENPSDMTENDYRHLGTDEDMYEMEKNTSSRPFSDTYTHIKDA